jgi:hypothetical protein
MGKTAKSPQAGRGEKQKTRQLETKRGGPSVGKKPSGVCSNAFLRFADMNARDMVKK